MITYSSSGGFGFQILFRLHGSAVFKSCTPALLSSIIYVLLYKFTHISSDGDEDASGNNNENEPLLDNPYPMGALVTAFSFLLIFRANFAYNRYWEALTAVHTMHSKWLDVATELAAFHYQAACYQSFQPPSFGSHALELQQEQQIRSQEEHQHQDDLRFLSSQHQQHHLANSNTSTVTSQMKQRQPRDPMTQEELEHQIDSQIGQDDQSRPSLRSRFQEGSTSFRNLRSALFGGKKKTEARKGSSSKLKMKRRNRLVEQEDENDDRDNNDKGGVPPQQTSPQEPNNDILKNVDHDPAPYVAHNSDHGTSSRVPRRRGEAGSPSQLRTVHFGSTTLLPPHHREMKKSINPLSHKNKEYNRQQKKRRNDSDFFDPKDGSPYSSFWHHARQRLQEGHLDPTQGVPIPYFLETVSHLLSLLSAVASSTLRNDLEEAESPLAEFRPNAPWPHVDPDKYRGSIRNRWYKSEHRSYTVLRYICGLSRTDDARKLYNTGRPFRVVGNVSDGEIQALQAARGPQAKVTLVALWLQELVSREYLAGSTGNVAPPIISRIYQFVSDGMAGYNQARKIAYLPFPFPHAQITTLFVLVIVGFMPILMLTYLDNVFFGFFWNWLTVMCFTGLHEVARELENPFQNIPNEIPLNNFQAQFNEALMVMFFGYHPDAFWLVASDTDNKSNGRDGVEMPSTEESSATQSASTSALGKSDENHTSITDHRPAATTTGGDNKNDDSAATPPRKTMARYETPLQMSSLDESMLVAPREEDATATSTEAKQHHESITEPFAVYFNAIQDEEPNDNACSSSSDTATSLQEGRSGSDGSAIFAPIETYYSAPAIINNAAEAAEKEGLVQVAFPRHEASPSRGDDVEASKSDTATI